MNTKALIRSWDPVIIAIAIFNVAIHFLCAGNLEYHRDELLYYSLGLHPDFGYSTVPPVIGWIAWFMENVFGYSVYSVRLFPALASGVMILLAASLTRELGGNRYAAFLASLGFTISIFFMRAFFLFQPVHIDILLWTLSIYLVVKYINSQKDLYLLLLGITAGFALLNKYLAGMLFAGLIVVIPFTQYRYVLSKKFFWLGTGAGFLVLLPNIIWQISKGFPVFHHINELYKTQLVYMDIPLFLKEQLLMTFFASVFTIAGLIYLLFAKSAKKFRFLGYLSLFVISGLMILKGKSYYTLGIIPLLIIAGAIAYEKWIQRKWLRLVLPLILVLLTLPGVPVGIPVFKSKGMVEYFKVFEKYEIDAGRRFEDGSIHSLPQDYADMLGWEELTKIADKAWQMIPDKKTAFIYCENYGQAGAITIIGKKYGLPEAVCFSESFRYWYPKSFNPDITSFIYINGELGTDVKMLFRKISIIGKISNPDAREFGTNVYLCEDPVMSFNKFWKERLEVLNR